MLPNVIYMELEQSLRDIYYDPKTGVTVSAVPQSELSPLIQCAHACKQEIAEHVVCLIAS